MIPRINSTEELVKYLTHSKWPSATMREFYKDGTLATYLPEVAVLYGIPQNEKWHPEVDTGIHIELAMDLAVRDIMACPELSFLVLTHDLGKAMTPRETLPSHKGHEKLGIPLVEDLCNRIDAPPRLKYLASINCKEHLNVHNAFELTTKRTYKLLSDIGMFNISLWELTLVLRACQIDARGRAGLEKSEYPQFEYLMNIATELNELASCTTPNIQYHNEANWLTTAYAVINEHKADYTPKQD